MTDYTPPERIPGEQLVHGMTYRVRARNFWVGVWNKEVKGFIGIRQKFGHRYLDVEYERGSGGHLGSAYAYEVLTPLPEGVRADMASTELFEFLDAFPVEIP